MLYPLLLMDRHGLLACLHHFCLPHGMMHEIWLVCMTVGSPNNRTTARLVNFKQLLLINTGMLEVHTRGMLIKVPTRH